MCMHVPMSARCLRLTGASPTPSWRYAEITRVGLCPGGSMFAATMRPSAIISAPIRGALRAACGRAITATPPLHPPASVHAAGMSIACQLCLRAQSEASGTLHGGSRCSWANTTSTSVARRNFCSAVQDVVLAVAMRSS